MFRVSLVHKVRLLNLTAIAFSLLLMLPPNTSPVSRFMTIPQLMVSFAFSIRPARFSFLFMKIYIFCRLDFLLQDHRPKMRPIGASRQVQCYYLRALTMMGFTQVRGLMSSKNYKILQLTFYLLLEQRTILTSARPQARSNPHSLVYKIY